jgi:phospholipase C
MPARAFDARAGRPARHGGPVVANAVMVVLRGETPMQAQRIVGRLLIVLVLLAPLAGTPAAQAAEIGNPINHVIVFYQENWSFDSLYGEFPGANGIAQVEDGVTQLDKNGQPYATLPQPINTNLKPAGPDARFPATLPVRPFDISPYVSPDQKIGDLPSSFYQEQAQIHGGTMDQFAALSRTAALVLGYYDATHLPEGQLAQQYTLADNFYHAAFGGSFLNHFWLICACTPTWADAPANKRIQLDAAGRLVKDGVVTPDGFAVNTAFTVNTPHLATITDTAQLLPQQTMPTIGDRLSAKGISWAWYSGGWNDALAGHPDPLFQANHQPFAYFANYADGTPARAAHLKDEQDFVRALRTNDLPAVSFVKAIGADNEHPGYTDLVRGQQHVADLVRAVQQSPYWADTAIIIAYDENGGFWDHVAPPAGDRWGPGTRVPAIIISPYARKGFIDHTQYDTTSILKFIETRWDLAPLGTRDAAANNLLNAFDFSAAAPMGMPQTGVGTVAADLGWLSALAALLVLAGGALRHWRGRRTA